jgi:peptidoglycan/xylan/chitin deacetylase (PgdA/CDA1 family)
LQTSESQWQRLTILFSGLALIVSLSPMLVKADDNRTIGKPLLPSSGQAATKIETKEQRLVQDLDRQNHWRGNRVLTIWRGDPTRKEIALTFDDGPHPSFTPRLLDLLQQLHVKATFFLVGKKVDQAPQIVARIAQEGHEVANHTYDHINLGKVSPEIVEAEIRRGNEAIYRACGKQPTLFRPPGGHHEEKVLQAAEKLNMITILWTEDPADFANPGADIIEERIFKKLGNGADILLHDGIEQTLQMLPDLVARLRQEGYRFITMKEMAWHLEATHLVHK